MISTMPKKRCSSSTCLRPLARGRVKTKGLRALEAANRELVKALQGLGGATWGPAPTLSARFFVGLDRGKQGKNRVGWCATQPETFTPEMLDARFAALRSIGMEAVNNSLPPDQRKSRDELASLFGLSRTAQRGWFESRAEDSHAYTVFWNPYVPGEDTPQKFADAMRALADNVSASLCQDEVIVAFETPTGNTSEGREGDPLNYQNAAGTFAGRRR